MHQHSNQCRLGHELPQKRQAFRSYHPAQEGYSGDIAAGAIQIGNKAEVYGIVACGEDNRDRRGRSLGCLGGQAVHNDYVHRTADKLCRHCGQSRQVIVSVAGFNADVPALNETDLRKEIGFECVQGSVGQAP